MITRERYASFLVRLHWIQDGEQARWIPSAQSAQTGEVYWFTDLDTLIQFLRSRFGAAAAEGDESAPQSHFVQ